MRFSVSAILVLMMAGWATGQVSTDEANQRLAAKQAEKAAAATRPATLTQGQVDQLLSQIEALRAQVDQLRIDNAALRKQLAAKAPTSRPAVAGKSPAAPGVQMPPPGRDKIVWVGMTEQEFSDIVLSDKRINAGLNFGRLVEESTVGKVYHVQLVWGSLKNYESSQWTGSVVIQDGKVALMRED